MSSGFEDDSPDNMTGASIIIGSYIWSVIDANLSCQKDQSVIQSENRGIKTEKTPIPRYNDFTQP